MAIGPGWIERVSWPNIERHERSRSRLWWRSISPRLVTQPIQKRLEPTSKLAFPIQCPANHGRPSKSRPPMSHRKTDLGILCPSKSAKVVLDSAHRDSLMGADLDEGFFRLTLVSRSHGRAIILSPATPN